MLRLSGCRMTYFFCSFCSPFSCSNSLMRCASRMTLCASKTRQGVRSGAIDALLMCSIWCSFRMTITSSSFSLRCFSSWKWWDASYENHPLWDHPLLNHTLWDHPLSRPAPSTSIASPADSDSKHLQCSADETESNLYEITPYEHNSYQIIHQQLWDHPLSHPAHSNCVASPAESDGQCLQCMDEESYDLMRSPLIRSTLIR